MSQIKRINLFLTNKNPKLIFVASCILILFFLGLVNLLIAPAPPSLPEYFHSKDENEITRGLNWHFANNQGHLLGDSKACILSGTKNVKINCDFISISQELNSERQVIQETIFSNKKNFTTLFWNSDSFYTEKINDLAFSPFLIEVKEIKNLKESQGIFGPEIQVTLTAFTKSLSPHFENLVKIFKNENEFEKFADKIKLKLPLEFEIKTTLHKNKYGYFLPIKQFELKESIGE